MKILSVIMSIFCFSAFANMENKKVTITNTSYNNQSFTVECIDVDCSRLEFTQNDVNGPAVRKVVERNTIKEFKKLKNRVYYKVPGRVEIDPSFIVDQFKFSETTWAKLKKLWKEGYHIKAIGNGVIIIGALVLDTGLSPVKFAQFLSRTFREEKNILIRKASKRLEEALKKLEEETSVMINVKEKKFKFFRELFKAI